MAFDTTAKIVITGETQGFDRAAGQVTQRMRDMETAISAARNTLATLGAGLSVGAFAAFTRSTIDAVAALDDMAETTGMSVENLSRWRQVARISGTEMGAFEAGVLKLSRALAGADEEGKGAAEAFQALGLSVAEMKRLSPDQQFEAFAKAMNKFADGANKTAIGQAVLTRQWRELAPLIKDYAEAGQIAANVTTEQAAAAERLQKEWNALALSAQNLAQSGIMKVVTAFQALRQEIKDKGIGGTIRDIIDPQSELSLQAQIADLRRKQSSAGTDSEFAKLESEIVAVQARLAEAIRLKGQLTGRPEELPQAPGISATAARPRATRTSRAASAEYWGIDVFRDATRDTEKLFADRAEMLEEYGLAGSKTYMKHLKEEYDFERWAQRELYQDELNQQKKIDDARDKAAEDSRREWERTSQGITDSLTDALLRGFEGGADAARNFVDTLKNMFASLVLRPIIQPIAQAGANLALGALGMGASGSASAGGIGDLLGIGSSLSSLTGGAGVGGLVANGLSAMGASTGIATGWGAAVGAVAPYLAVAGIAYSMFKKKRGGPKVSGSSIGNWQGDYASLVNQLGGTPGSFDARQLYDSDPLGTTPSEVHSLLLGAGGSAIYNQANVGAGRGEDELKKAIADQQMRMLIAALRETDFTDAADAIFDALDPATASAEQFADAIQRATAAQEQATAAQQEQLRLINTWGNVARDVAAFRVGLAGSDASPLDPYQKLREAGGTFWTDVQAAKGGDLGAASAAQSSAAAYLSAARGYYASGSQYAATYEDVQWQLSQIQNAALGRADMGALVDETRTGNQANEAGLNALLNQLVSIDARLASIESTNALAAAA